MTEPADQRAATETPALAERIEVDPAGDAEAWRLSVPAKPACYLLADEHDRPVLLATVADLRSALVRRLVPERAGEEAATRLDYRAVVRRVYWRQVASRFEGDWAYLENARRLFPEQYRSWIKRWRAHWVGIDPSAEHPRFEARSQPFGPAGTCFGPFGASAAARRYIQMLEDLFDLCRYPHILEQAPHGTACDYKQMGRCPAPCDGSVSMDQYRRQLEEAIRFIETGGREWVERIERRMRQASADLRFEEAARLRSQRQRAKAAESPEAAWVAPLSRFAFVALQPGDRKWAVQPFLIGPGRIEPAEPIGPKEPQQRIGSLARQADQLTERAGQVPDDAAAQREPTERMGLVAWHLTGGNKREGVFLRADRARDRQTLAEAVERVRRRHERNETHGANPWA